MATRFMAIPVTLILFIYIWWSPKKLVVNGPFVHIHSSSREAHISFVGHPRFGSSYLRGHMLQEELSRINSSLIIHPPSLESIRSKHYDANVCIFIKPKVQWGWFKYLDMECDFSVIDVLDAEVDSALDLVEQFSHYSDLFITSSRKLENELTRLGQNAVTIYHQHTNIHDQIVHGANHEDVQTMAFMTGVEANLPSKEILEKIGSISCSLGVQFFTLVYSSVNRESTGVQITPFGECSDINSPVHSRPYKTVRTNEYVDLNHTHPYPEQLYYQQLPIKVDIGLLLPPEHFTYLDHKPATRLLWWWSHGIPTIMYKYPSYTELCEEYNYRIDGEAPVISSHRNIQYYLEKLIHDRLHRERLSEIGLHASQNFTPRAVANQYLHMYNSLVQDTRFPESIQFD